MIDLGPLHITLALVLWEIGAIHGIWSRWRTYAADLRQLRYNRAQGINGPMEDYGVRTVSESARAAVLYIFIAIIGVAGSLIDPVPDSEVRPGAALVSWALVAMVWGFSFSDYVTSAVARRLRAARAHNKEQARINSEADASREHGAAFEATVVEGLRVGRETQAMVGVVHTLVNSKLTAAYEMALQSTRRELALLQQTHGSGEAIAAAEERISDLERLLVERAEQAVAVDAQIAAADERARA